MLQARRRAPHTRTHVQSTLSAGPTRPFLPKQVHSLFPSPKSEEEGVKGGVVLLRLRRLARLARRLARRMSCVRVVLIGMVAGVVVVVVMVVGVVVVLSRVQRLQVVVDVLAQAVQPQRLVVALCAGGGKAGGCGSGGAGGCAEPGAARAHARLA